MRKDDVRKLAHGVYRVFWRDGSSSVASVGSTYDGTRWVAPSNWTSRADAMVIWTTDWRKIKSVELIATK